LALLLLLWLLNLSMRAQDYVVTHL
jgi:hypothetical protein